MKFSIVTVTWNCARALATLVASMNEHLDPDCVQLVVVDNASGDNSFEAAAAWRGALVTEALPENRGFGAANNAGVRLATNDAVVLLNPDTWLVDGSLSELAADALRLDAIVGPRMLTPDGTIQPSASASPVGVWPWVRAVVPVTHMPRPIVARTEPWRAEEATRVAWLTGACLAAPRGLLERLGPFDESIELYAEDMELGLRATAAGVGVFFLPGVARVVHVGDVSAMQRYGDAGLGLTAVNTARTLNRRFGATLAGRGLAAERLRISLRLYGKRALGRDADRERAWLDALEASRRGRNGGQHPG